LLAGFRGAYFNTRRFLALVAPHREGAYVNYPSALTLAGDQFHPGDPQRKKMLDSASSDAGMAAATLHKVNNHSPSHASFSISLLCQIVNQCGRSMLYGLRQGAFQLSQRRNVKHEGIS
jgi:hypothetical protein